MTFWCGLVTLLENPEDPSDSGRTLQKRLAAFPDKHSTEWEACMDKKKTRVILIIYFYDKETDTVSAIVKFLLI